jgi:hypothetical protein
MITIINITKSNCSNDLKDQYKDLFSELGYNTDHYNPEDIDFFVDLAGSNGITLSYANSDIEN